MWRRGVPAPAMIRDLSAKRGLEDRKTIMGKEVFGKKQKMSTALEGAGFIVNDTVMGGRSDSELVMSDQAQALHRTRMKSRAPLSCTVISESCQQAPCPDRELSFAARSPSVAVVALPPFDFSRGTAESRPHPRPAHAEPQDRGAFLAMLRSATGVALKIRRSKACLRADALDHGTAFFSKCFPLRIQGCASWKLQLNSRHFSIQSTV